ncbi:MULTISPECIES: YaaL family protein [unclassified Candidatus Frackibacter]|uniref:YaaL family protein n=1 Tax=unclassified Candidatus Frackibacter TaxID=2648818 RepID=UPI000793E17A|nr:MULTISPECIES: YaaL family protein [unclassified Candidatus Frackibacter]KXS45815.1 MAG: hypothetical protein AWU54_106 [Candidatus Frackibacter sp. T328-2]SDC54058.1 Protein of unknown function [Candidatus Frackibacter sp. WG11]SEM66292.1 Protein of unknown function [Candidatus Frackibacter sp. WG12]SFL77658.1 Protein of unknown function [Candidatus Frackibacter sp. WG13]
MITSFVNQLSNRLNVYYQEFKAELVTLEETDYTIDEELEDARQEWLEAREYFETVNDPDLIDYAIYSLEAAEARYNYLLKEVRRSQSHR